MILKTYAAMKPNIKAYLCGIFALIIIFQSCRPTVPVPKPRGYFRSTLPPKHEYKVYDNNELPFTFEYPEYSVITKDSNLNLLKDAQYWFNINIPSLNATIFMSYKQIAANQSIVKLINESYALSHAHDVRADYINAPEFKTKNGLTGVFYTVGGNAASFYQFYATDSVKHFLRGALYFNATPNADSLKPGAIFLREDMQHLLESLKFRH